MLYLALYINKMQLNARARFDSGFKEQGLERTQLGAILVNKRVYIEDRHICVFLVTFQKTLLYMLGLSQKKS